MVRTESVSAHKRIKKRCYLQIMGQRQPRAFASTREFALSYRIRHAHTAFNLIHLHWLFVGSHSFLLMPHKPNPRLLLETQLLLHVSLATPDFTSHVPPVLFVHGPPPACLLLHRSAHPVDARAARARGAADPHRRLMPLRTTKKSAAGRACQKFKLLSKIAP